MGFVKFDSQSTDDWLKEAEEWENKAFSLSDANLNSRYLQLCPSLPHLLVITARDPRGPETKPECDNLDRLLPADHGKPGRGSQKSLSNFQGLYNQDEVGTDAPETNAKTLFRSQDKEMLDYVVKESGFEEEEDLLHSVQEVAHNLYAMEILHFNGEPLEFPAWVQKPTLPGWDRRRLVETLQDRHLSLDILGCAEDVACRRLVAGDWLRQMLSTMGRLEVGTNDPRLRLVVFSASRQAVLAMLRLLDYGRPERVLFETSGFAIEFRRTVVPEFRFLYHQPDPYKPRLLFFLLFFPAPPSSPPPGLALKFRHSTDGAGAP